jgi:hypothetical protein
MLRLDFLEGSETLAFTFSSSAASPSAAADAIGSASSNTREEASRLAVLFMQLFPILTMLAKELDRPHPVRFDSLSESRFLRAACGGRV